MGTQRRGPVRGEPTRRLSRRGSPEDASRYRCGQDPFHSGQYGVAYTKGLQWGNDTRYTKAIGALKHYTIYSVENSGGKNGGSEGFSRGSDYFEIAMKDIEETYLPQFKAPVVEACA